jgi:two-component system CheB/CheR fusion protein
LRLDLQAGLHRAFEQNAATLTLPLAVQFNGTPRQVSLHVRPYTRNGAAVSALILFLEGGPADPSLQSSSTPADSNVPYLVTQLRNELTTTQGHLRTSRSQYEAVTEELRASTEEQQSINEEYRSMSEELETSKEQLQSINGPDKRRVFRPIWEQPSSSSSTRRRKTPDIYHISYPAPAALPAQYPQARR